MKKLTRIIAVVALCLGTALTATAQFKIGPRVGIAVNKLHFNKEVFDTNNRTGFTGGLEAEFTVPVVGVGIDASVMYVRRTASMDVVVSDSPSTQSTHTLTRNLDYIDVPVYLKWKMGFPIISKVVKPYLFTGPDFAFLTSSKNLIGDVESGKCDISWNFGLGVEVLNHLQIGAGYGFGINKAAKLTGVNSNAQSIEGKSRCWTVTAAYLF